MKLNLKKICAVVLAGAVFTCAAWTAPVVDVAAAADTGVSQIPGTVKTEKKLDGSFLSVSGFAKGYVNDRSQYTEESEEYAVVTTEDEFFDALDAATYGEVKVIELRADMDLGWNQLSDYVKDMYEGSLVEPYADSTKVDKTPVGNPVLIESGVTTITIDGIDGLTIFSTTGNSLKHAEFKFNSDVNDLVIRNLEFTEIWEWDDWRETGLGVTGGRGNRKRTGWTNVKLNGCKNVWIDHCTFGNSFDGNVDVENGSYGITLSWCKVGDDDVSVGSVTYKTAMYLEELYQQSKLEGSTVNSFIIYKVMRDNGMTPEQIMKFMSQHDKAHLCGAGDKDSWIYDKAEQKFLDSPNYEKEDANENIRLTLAYNSYSDIGQRLPMVRSGIGHLYNCYVNDWDLAEVINILNSDPMKTGKSIRTQISNAGGTCVTLARGMDARNGASVAADTCVYYGAQTAITGTAYHPNGSNFTTEDFRYKWGYNYALVVNSSFQKYGSSDVYTGSSWDNNGKNPFIGDSDYWNEGDANNNKAAEAIIGNWKWRQDGPSGNAKPGESLTELPYAYQTFPLEDVKENTTKYSGFRKIEMSASDWLKVEYTDEFAIQPVDSSIEIPITSIEMTKKESILYIEEEFLQLEAEALPYNTTEKESSYTWTSSNPEVARVNECGLVIPVQDGKTTITVKTANGLSSSCEVTVTNLPKKVEITNIPETIYVGDIVNLKSVVTPEDIIDDSVVWENNGVNMELLDETEGIFKAVKAGRNPIKAITVLKGNRIGTNTGTSISKTLQIVNPDVFTTGVTVETSASLKVGGTTQLHATVLPENATNKNVVWSVSDSAVATVDENGVVTAVTAGATTVTVTTVNGGFTATCQIVVEKETTPVTPPAVEVALGDVDDNGKIELADAQLALKIALKIAIPDAKQEAAADADRNGKIELADAQKILKVALKIESFDKEEQES